MLGLYVLDQETGEARPARSLEEFSQQMGDITQRRVAHTLVAPGVSVSTVFLGVDHNFTGQGSPILYETMVFLDSTGWAGVDHFTSRYATRKEALAGHEATVHAVKSFPGLGVQSN